MAKQVGIIKLQGTIGDISFYKQDGQHYAKGKGGVEASRIATDPAFQRTRENGVEFGKAGKGSKLIRNAIRLMLQNASDNRVASRLTGQMVGVVRSDVTNLRGERTVQDGNLGLIQGFEFNKNAKLGATLFAPYTISFDRGIGEADVSVPSFVPSASMAAPSGTTHYKLNFGVAEVDFENESYQFVSEDSTILPYDSNSTSALGVNPTLSTLPTADVIVIMSIEFYQEVNGQMYSLKNGSHNPLAMVVVDQA